VAASAFIGTSLRYAREDHIHKGASGGTTPLSDADPSPTNAAAVAGTSTSASRGDHIHNLTFSGIPPVGPGTASAGSSEIPARRDHVHPAQTVPAPATAAPADVADTATVGTSALYARSDHVHKGASGGATPLSDAVPVFVAGNGMAGTSTSASRGDHVHGLHFSDIPPAAPGAASAGSSEIPARRDHVHPAQTLPVPATAAPADVAETAAVGTSALYARSDHVHKGAVPKESAFLELLSGTWTLTDNNVDYTINNYVALHAQLRVSNPPRMMDFVIEYIANSIPYSYRLNCPGVATPLLSHESRTFMCFGWRERTNAAITAELIVAPRGYRIKVSNIDARGNTTVRFTLWGTI